MLVSFTSNVWRVLRAGMWPRVPYLHLACLRCRRNSPYTSLPAPAATSGWAGPLLCSPSTELSVAPLH